MGLLGAAFVRLVVAVVVETVTGPVVAAQFLRTRVHIRIRVVAVARRAAVAIAVTVEVLVDLAVAVVVDAVVGFGHERVDGGVTILAVEVVVGIVSPALQGVDVVVPVVVEVLVRQSVAVVVLPIARFDGEVVDVGGVVVAVELGLRVLVEQRVAGR